MLDIATDGVDIHIGVTRPLISTRNDIFGDVVNLAARLAARANPQEALIDSSIVDALPPDGRAALHALGPMSFKGRSEPILVYRLVGADASRALPVATTRTTLPGHLAPRPVRGRRAPSSSGMTG